MAWRKFSASTARLGLGVRGEGGGGAEVIGGGAAEVIIEDAGGAGLGAGGFPGGLAAGVGEGVTSGEAPGAGCVPEALGELELEFGVFSGAEILDGVEFAGVEAGGGAIEGAEDGEGKCQDDDVGGDFAGGGEGEAAAAVGGLAHGGESGAGLDGDIAGGKVGGNGVGEFLVAAFDMKAFVGEAVDLEISIAAGEGVNEVERALGGGFGAEFGGEGDVKKLAKRGAEAAGDAGFDPGGDAHVVEGAGGGRMGVEGGGVAGRFEIGLERGEDGLEIFDGAGARVVLTVDVEGFGGVRRLGGDEVVEEEAEALGEGAHGGVVGVDEFAAPFGDLLAGPEPLVVGEDASAGAAGGFVDFGAESMVKESEGAVEAGEAGADDGDFGFWGGIGGEGQREGGGRGGGERFGEEAASAEGGRGAGMGEAAEGRDERGCAASRVA